jgi:hypothetical protein
MVDDFSRSLAMPRLAGGGMVLAGSGGGGGGVSGMTPVHLHFPDTKTVYQVMADNQVAAALYRVAIKASLTSNGRKPGRG